MDERLRTLKRQAEQDPSPENIHAYRWALIKNGKDRVRHVGLEVGDIVLVTEDRRFGQGWFLNPWEGRVEDIEQGGLTGWVRVSFIKSIGPLLSGQWGGYPEDSPEGFMVRGSELRVLEPA